MRRFARQVQDWVAAWQEIADTVQTSSASGWKLRWV
jgi:hypothetical protein